MSSSETLRRLGPTQQKLLRNLIRHPDGMAAEELSARLQISATAVRQHLAVLGRDGFVRKGRTRPTGHRPQRLFELTERGREIFPRLYAALAHQLIDEIRQLSGADCLRTIMQRLGAASGHAIHIAAESSGTADLTSGLARAMNSAGYETDVGGSPAAPEVIAHNCVFQRLAGSFPEVCDYDLEFIRHATGMDVRHTECIVRDGKVCRFLLAPKADDHS